MILKAHTPCDDGICPYLDQFDGFSDCEWHCSAEEPEDVPDLDPEEVAEFLAFADFVEGR